MGNIKFKNGFKSITIDHATGAIYITVKDSPISKTHEIDENVFVDVDSKGKLVGIELIRKEVTLKIARKIAKKVGDPIVTTFPSEIRRDAGVLCGV